MYNGTVITDQEITKVIDAFKGVFSTRTEIEGRFDDMTQKFSNLQTAVDKYSQKADGYFQEMLLLSHKVERHERWLKEIADKLGVELKV